MEPVFFADPAALRAWFLDHHADAGGCHKKHTVGYERYQVRFTP